MVVQGNMVTAVAGGLGLAFVGYCVYFDHKRRSDPDFKRKLIESNFEAFRGFALEKISKFLFQFLKKDAVKMKLEKIIAIQM